MQIRLLWKFSAVACVALVLSPAGAEDALLPDKSIGVLARPRPEYDAIGIQLGTLTLTPRLTLGSTYDDNIYATQSGPQSDFLTTVVGDAALQSHGSYLPFSVNAGFASVTYADQTVENYLDYNGAGALTYNFASSTTLNLSVGWLRNHQSRTDPSFPSIAVKAPAVDTADAQLDLTRIFAFGTAALSADYKQFRYTDAELAQGTELDQSFRNRNQLTLQARADLVIHHSASAFVKLIRTDQNYHSDTADTIADRSSTASAAYGGLAFRITNLMDGDIGVGLLTVSNSDPAQRSLNSLALSSNIQFYVTQLITATLNVQRTSGAADIKGSSSYIGTSGTLSVDYELRRNLLLSARYTETQRVFSGVSRSDTTHLGEIAARWLLNRRLNVGLGYSYTSEDLPFAAGPGRKFADNALTATLNFAL